MNDFPFDHDSGKSMGRHMSNATMQGMTEHRKLREEIERLRARLEISDASSVDGIEARDATIKGQDEVIERLREGERILRDALNLIASKTGSHDPCQALVKLARRALLKHKEQSDG